MTSTDPRIGMSLSLRYLLADPDAAESHVYGPADAFLADLRAASASSVELRAISAKTGVEQALAALQRVWDAGLSATLHGALPPAASGEDWPAAVPALTAAMEAMRKRGGPRCPIALHAYADKTGQVGACADASVARLAQMARWTEREAMPVDLALELNRDKGEVDPSVTYQGVLEMQSRVGHPRVGICWDLGHTWSNVLLRQLPPDAPAAFARAVIHTHIHDLGPTGQTHWPLTQGRLPLERFVGALREAGYGGVWNVELEPARYMEEPDIRRRALASVGRLREALKATAAT